MKQKKKISGYRIFFAVLILIHSVSCKKGNFFYQVLNTPIPVSDIQGNARSYRLFWPASRESNLPLLVYFHGVMSPEFSQKIKTLPGYTGSPVEETGLIEFCRRRKIVLLVPEAFYPFSFLDCQAKGWLVEEEMDGVEKIIDTVTGHYSIARHRIFLAGISYGAVFAHFLANHRPDAYAAIISHSQGYMDKNNHPLSPSVNGPRFGVLFAYTQGDYPSLKEWCQQSNQLYRQAGYQTNLIPDLPPESHRWADTQNAIFWKWLNKLAKKD